MRKISILLLIVMIIFTGCSTGNTTFNHSMRTISTVDTVSLIKDETITEDNDGIGEGNVVVEVVEITSENEVFLNNLVGDVLVERNGQVLEAKEMSLILEGDIILTGIDSSVVILISDMRQVILEENTILLLKENSVISSTEKTVLVLKHGSIVSDVKDKLNGKSSFEILTPSMITSIRGTVVNVTHDQNTNTSNVSFYEGYGRVADIDTKNITTIVAGQSLDVDNGVFDFKLISEEQIETNSPIYLSGNASTIDECLTKVSVENENLLSPVVMEEVDKFQIYFDDVDDDTKRFYDVKTISEDQVIDFDKLRKKINKAIEKEETAIERAVEKDEKALDKDDAKLEKDDDKDDKDLDKENDALERDAVKDDKSLDKDDAKLEKDADKDDKALAKENDALELDAVKDEKESDKDDAKLEKDADKDDKKTAEETND